MHRRDFLDLNIVGRTAGQVLALLDDRDPSPVEEIPLLRLSRRAMATTFELLLPYGTPRAVDVATAAFDRLDELEAQLTVYRDNSEVSRLNRSAFHAPIPVEPGLFDQLKLATRVHDESGGAFDVTAGAIIKAWGFFKGPRRVPSDDERQQALARVGMRHVELDTARRTVRFLRPGLEINLGSIGKGYALDRVAEYLCEEWGITSALIHGGYSSVVTIGTQPGERGWKVGVAHPWQPERRLAIVRLRGRALGTSAATHRHLEYNGKKLGHVLDPRTGWPAEGIASATAVAATGAEADALSTAFYIEGVEFTRRYCATHHDVGAVLLPEDADRPVVFGLAADEIEILA